MATKTWITHCSALGFCQVLLDEGFGDGEVVDEESGDNVRHKHDSDKVELRAKGAMLSDPRCHDTAHTCDARNRRTRTLTNASPLCNHPW